MLQDALMRLVCLFTNGIDCQDMPNTLNDRYFASASPADQHIQISIEMKSGTVKKSTVPGHRYEFGMRLRRGITIHANSKIRIKKNQPQPLYRQVLHLDEAARSCFGQRFRAVHVRCVDNGNWPVPLMLGVLVFQDGAYILRSSAHRAGQRTRREVRIFPGAHARLTSERCQKAVIGGNMGCDGDSALAVNASEKLQAILGAIGRQAAVIVNAEFADEPLQAVIFLRVIKAQEVDAVFGCGLESAKDKDASFPCPTDQAP